MVDYSVFGVILVIHNLHFFLLLLDASQTPLTHEVDL